MSGRDVSVVSAVWADLARLGGDLGESAEAAAALALARQLDDLSNGATAKSMCAKALAELMSGLRERRPAESDRDVVSSLSERAALKLARG